MKQIISIVVMCLLMFTISKAQLPTPPTITINCKAGTTNNCLNTDPTPVKAEYEATIDNGGYSSWSRVLLWDAVFDGKITNGSTLTPTVEWYNTPNTPTKYLKLSVTYSKQGNSNQSFSAQVLVVVKYIGPITSINIPGASPVNPAKGGISVVPCGIQNITISVPTPSTNPTASVVYNWTLPSGWNGSSTSNSIAVTTDAGVNDGSLLVTAKRSDGTVEQSYSVVIKRPRVENAIISSVAWSPDDKPLCSGQTRQLSGTSTVNATNFSWTTTGGTSITAGANQSIVTVNGTTNGTLTLAATNACTVIKNRTWNIYAGAPQFTSSEVLVDGHPNYYPNYTSGSSYISLQGGGTCQTYKWELFGGSGYFYPGYCGSCSNVFNGITFNDCNSGNASTTSSMAIRVRTANRCGQGVDVIIPLQTTGGYRMTSPNPAINTVSVEFEKESTNTLKSLKLVNANTSAIARSFDVVSAQKTQYFSSTNLVTFDVTNLERGNYYLLLTFGAENKTFSELIHLQ